MSFVDILFSRGTFPPPALGAGRIHTIDDADDEIPDQPHRFAAIILAIKHGGQCAESIRHRLGFHIPKSLLIADCEALAERGLLTIQRAGSHAQYVLA